MLEKAALKINPFEISFPRNISTKLLLSVLLGLAFLVRLDDLTNPPLDFHPTRQLRSFIIARGMYYQTLENAPNWQRQYAEAVWHAQGVIEPPILEYVTALAYRIWGGEIMWIPRILSSLLWLAGALPLYELGKDLVSPAGGLAATVFYLFLPYGVIASRSFQPDPWMVSLIISAFWCLARWRKKSSWGWALAFGLLAGLSIFVKLIAVFFIAGAFAGILIEKGVRQSMRDRQVWVMGLVAILPGALYTFYGTFVAGFLHGQFQGRFYPEMLIDPFYYFRWEQKAAQVTGYIPILLGILGLLLLSGNRRALVAGAWGGYIIFGLFFPHHFASHDYYHLPLVPIVAISMAPLVDTVWKAMIEATRNSKWTRIGIVLVLFSGVFLTGWDTHLALHTTNYRDQPGFWTSMGDLLRHSQSVIALSEDYGYRLAYWGWINPRVWPSYGDLVDIHKADVSEEEFKNLFNSYTAGMDYFLITRFEELPYQPKLENHLWSDCELQDQGPGYAVFHLPCGF
jgi:4-amino-4-deoxy-L-arabinose transferase-like glycosyltransferase